MQHKKCTRITSRRNKFLSHQFARNAFNHGAMKILEIRRLINPRGRYQTTKNG
jgi:hypothetical protein